MYFLLIKIQFFVAVIANNYCLPDTQTNYYIKICKDYGYAQTNYGGPKINFNRVSYFCYICAIYKISNVSSNKLIYSILKCSICWKHSITYL